MQRKAKDSENVKGSDKAKVSENVKGSDKATGSDKAKVSEKAKVGGKAPDGEKSGELLTVRGVVAPSEWDMRDEVTAVTIYAQDEAEYLVNARPMVKRLMKFMDEEIEAHGMLGVDEYGNEVFVVAEFAPIDVETDEDS